MASIPLYCNICPKQPEFSDISHLLTHVASKGHLSHYFKAQVRARQDEKIRHKIDIYDQWYDQYQIEKLLSQRMSSKELKDGNKPTITNNNRKSAHAARATKPHNRRNKRSTTRDPSPSPVKAEEIIDPQLAHGLLSPQSKHPLLDSPSQDAATRHRAHIPRMLDWQAESPYAPRRSSSVPHNCRSTPRALRSVDTLGDAERDYFRTFLQSPTRTIYPDPLSLSSYIPQRVPTKSESDEEKDITCPSPVLKGVKWPGMSLFDSANQEAQRLRNQKKDGSVLEQMEIDSAAIEPMEHIYWPEGGLKKRRLITGNVESSPIKDPTPPPRRPRARASKVLGDLSTNAPKLGKKRGRKPGKTNDSGMGGLQNMAGRALTTLKTVYPRNAHNDYDPLNKSENDTLLTNGSPVNRHKASFTVFKDTAHKDPQAFSKSGSSEARMPPNEVFWQENARHHGLPMWASYRTKSLSPLCLTNPFSFRVNSSMSSLERSSSQSVQPSAANENRENLAPIFEPNNHAEEEDGQDEPERVTQRYFSVTGNQPPQFFSTLPPQMDFGGMAGPAFHGTSLNPLNPFLRQHYQQPQYSPTSITQIHPTTDSAVLPDDSASNPSKSGRTKKQTADNPC
ncbi:MAG: hypothetical protein Q9217_004444 [Psora testacea]